MGFDVGGITLTSSSGATLSMDSGATNWMKVDVNGILTRPQTPYMRGQLTGRGAPYNAGGGPLLVTADVNFGNCWNDATGYWTCPVDGYYMATLGQIAGGVAGYGYPRVQKNGADYVYTHWNNPAAVWHYVSLSAIVNCAAGDTLRWVIASYSPANNGFYGAGGHGMWSISLLA